MQTRNLKVSIVALTIGLIGSASFAASAAKPASEAATAAAKVTLSSAKTVRELVELDDKLALNKERNALLTEDAKTREIDPGIKKTEDQSKTLQFERDNIAAAKKSAETAASNIVVTSIMGIDGSRVVEGTVGDKPFHIYEWKASDLGWTLISIRGQCADFEKLKPVQNGTKKTKSKSSKVDLVKSTKVVAGERKTACFSQITAQPRTYGSSGIRIPVPLPISKSQIPMPVGLQ